MNLAFRIGQEMSEEYKSPNSREKGGWQLLSKPLPPCSHILMLSHLENLTFTPRAIFCLNILGPWNFVKRSLSIYLFFMNFQRTNTSNLYSTPALGPQVF